MLSGEVIVGCFFVGQAEAAGVRLGWCGFAGLSRLENAAIEIGSFCRIAQ
jgi:hypothetical protein